MSDRIHLPRLAPPVEDDGQVRARAVARLRGVAGGLLVLIALVGLRGVQLAVIPLDRTLRAAAVQRWDPVMHQAGRGEIVDRRGHRLAVSVPTPQIVADPARLQPDEIGAVAADLARILDLDEADVARRLGRNRSRYQRLATRVHPAAAQAVDALGNPALYVEEPLVRYYPEEQLASQVLGFVNAQGTGREGLEAAYEAYLRGGMVLRQRRRDRRGISVDDPTQRASSHAGMSVHLTLDRTVQRIAERALQGAVERSDPKAAVAVVVHVETGDLLAIANYPTFDPNRVAGAADHRRNRAVEFAFEPGSVFKPFTLAASIEEGRVAPATLLDCRGPMVVGPSEIHDTHPLETCSVRDILKRSSNIGSARIALDLGAERFLAYVRAFGFGEATGIGLPAEGSGIVRRADRVQPIELATTAYGQGIAVTPLQLAMGIAALGNDGVLMQARLVDRVVDAHGVPELVTRPRAIRQVVSGSTARKVLDMMVAVVEEDGGTGHEARVAGYSVAGKTGTAEKVRSDGRGYGADRVASFVSLAPARDPVIAVVVLVDEPRRGSHSGGVAAAPVTAEIVGATLRYLGVPEDAVDGPPSLAGIAPADAPLPPRFAVAQVDGGWKIPDLAGRALRDAGRALGPADLRVAVQGNGRVVGQMPTPGSVLSPGERLALILR